MELEIAKFKFNKIQEKMERCLQMNCKQSIDKLRQKKLQYQNVLSKISQHTQDLDKILYAYRELKLRMERDAEYNKCKEDVNNCNLKHCWHIIKENRVFLMNYLARMIYSAEMMIERLPPRRKMLIQESLNDMKKLLTKIQSSFVKKENVEINKSKSPGRPKSRGRPKSKSPGRPKSRGRPKSKSPGRPKSRGRPKSKSPGRPKSRGRPKTKKSKSPGRPKTKKSKSPGRPKSRGRPKTKKSKR